MVINLIKLFLLKIILFLPLSFLQLIEYFQDKKHNKIPLHERYGINCYLGLAGSGKTISMIYRLYKLRKKYGNDIYIITNFKTPLADYIMKKKPNGKTDYSILLGFYNKPVVVAWDELQNDFKSTTLKDFPDDLLRRLTQVRKGNGMLLLYTSQDFKGLDSTLRKITHYFIDCKTFKNRLTTNVTYYADDYIQKYESVSVDNKLKIPVHSVSYFIQKTKIRKLYNSFEYV